MSKTAKQIRVPNDIGIESTGSYPDYEEFILAIATNLKKNWNQSLGTIKVQDVLDHFRWRTQDVWAKERQSYACVEQILKGQGEIYSDSWGGNKQT